MPNKKTGTTLKKTPKPKWKVMLTILGHNYTGEDSTFEKACQKLGLGWKDIKGKGVITVWKGDKKVEKIWNRPMIVRLVNNPVTRQVWAERFELMLK